MANSTASGTEMPGSAAADTGATDGRAPDAIGPSDHARQPRRARIDGGSSGGAQALDFDDDEVYSGRGNTARMGGTANAQGGDSGRLGPPGEMLSGRNGPSDTDKR